MESYPFHIIGKSSRVYTCESPIDAMSHATLTKLHGMDWTEDHRISTGCLSDKALDYFLQDILAFREVQNSLKRSAMVREVVRENSPDEGMVP